jgi:hypothetical protein
LRDRAVSRRKLVYERRIVSAERPLPHRAGLAVASYVHDARLDASLDQSNLESREGEFQVLNSQNPPRSCKKLHSLSCHKNNPFVRTARILDRQIAGSYTSFATFQHGFVGANGVFTTIDVPGAFGAMALGINNAGQIVGQSSAGSFLDYDTRFRVTPRSRSLRRNVRDQVKGLQDDLFQILSADIPENSVLAFLPLG